MPKKRFDTAKVNFLLNYDILAKSTHSKHKEVFFSRIILVLTTRAPAVQKSTNHHTRVCAPQCGFVFQCSIDHIHQFYDKMYQSVLLNQKLDKKQYKTNSMFFRSCSFQIELQQNFPE